MIYDIAVESNNITILNTLLQSKSFGALETKQESLSEILYYSIRKRSHNISLFLLDNKDILNDKILKEAFEYSNLEVINKLVSTG